MSTTLLACAAACLGTIALGASTNQGANPMTPTTPPTTLATSTTTATTLAVNGTRLYVERRGDGSPLLLIHGGGEDASMVAAQADDLAAAGYDVVSYDRRGTGRSGRDDWPGGGADQHADDARALLDALGWTTPTVVGVSSGAVVALDLAARHPDAVGSVVAWEPPAAGLVPGAEELTAAVMAPVDAHLAAHPGDFVGAQAILLSAVLGFPVDVDDPVFAAARANAEPFIRDEPAITTTHIDTSGLAAADVTVAVGADPNELIAAAVDVLASLTGREPVRVDADHEVYLSDPDVLTGIVTTLRRG